MANQEQLGILKQGVDVWNKWRKDNPSIEINLSGATLGGVRLEKANLVMANLVDANLKLAILYEADFRGAQLSGATFEGAHLSKARLSGVDFRGVDLNGVHFIEADLSGAELSGTDLGGVDFRRADINGANLMGAYLGWSDLSGADLSDALLYYVLLPGCNLSGASLKRAKMRETTFTNNDLSNTIGLEFVEHDGASTLGADTLKLSMGKIPEVFLRGCGLSDWEIESTKLYNPDLSNEEINKILYRMYDIRATQTLQISPLFISYSHADNAYVDKLEELLNEKGIRFWRDIHDMKAGRIEAQIDKAIRQNSTVLLILSKNSIHSDWVQHEVRLARKLEKDSGQDVLCPVALDGSWKNSSWPERIMEQVMEYNILDFSEWNDDDKFEKMFVRLLDGLNLYYKKDGK